MNTQNYNLKTTARALIAAAAVCAAMTGAARADGVRQMHVKYADLDVATGAGAAALYGRIKVAAARVCAMPGEGSLARLAQAKACEQRAIAEAVAAVGSPALTRAYQVKSGETGHTQLASIE